MSFKEGLVYKLGQNSDDLLLAVTPNHYDYDEFEGLCNKINQKVIMINGKLDDAAVGIGSVARERRNT